MIRLFVIGVMAFASACAPAGISAQSPTPTPSATRSAQTVASPTAAPTFPTVRTAAGVVWDAVQAPQAAGPTPFVTWWVKGSWPASTPGSVLGQILRPTGPGPFPTVVVVHGIGTHSLAQLQWAAKLTDAGYMVVVGCWNSTWVCPRNVPSDAVGGLADLAAALPDAVRGQIGMVGIGAGGAAAEVLRFAVARTDVKAVVLDCGVSPNAYPAVPVLLLATPTNADAVREYAQKLSANKTVVETKYFGTGSSTAIMQTETQSEATQLTVAFLAKYLKP